MPNSSHRWKQNNSWCQRDTQPPPPPPQLTGEGLKDHRGTVSDPWWPNGVSRCLNVFLWGCVRILPSPPFQCGSGQRCEAIDLLTVSFCPPSSTSCCVVNQVLLLSHVSTSSSDPAHRQPPSVISSTLISHSSNAQTGLQQELEATVGHRN